MGYAQGVILMHDILELLVPDLQLMDPLNVSKLAKYQLYPSLSGE